MPVILSNRNGNKKVYQPVAERVRNFRKDHPITSGWAIVTKMVSALPDEKVLFVAKILDSSGKVVASGYAEEIRGSNEINETSAVENCETSAIGRALAAAGYGDGEYASADELNAAIQAQKTLAEKGRLIQLPPPESKAEQSNLDPVVAEVLTNFGLVPEAGLVYQYVDNHLVISGNTHPKSAKLLKAGFSKVNKWKEFERVYIKHAPMISTNN